MVSKYIGLVELTDESYYDVILEDNFLVFGSNSNSTFFEHHKFPYDDFFSLDENLQECINELEYQISNTKCNNDCND